MKTQEKIKLLCKKKYNISISVYEKKLGYSNGSLSKEGVLRSDRLLAVSRDLGVSMESLMDDELLNVFQICEKAEISFSEEEMNVVLSYRKSDSITKSMVLRCLGLEKIEKKEVV